MIFAHFLLFSLICLTCESNHVKKAEQSVLDLLIDKPGYCPDYHIYILTSEIEIECPKTKKRCLGDVRCEGKKKCCPNQCGRSCVKPSRIQGLRYLEEKDHPGFDIEPYAARDKEIAEQLPIAEKIEDDFLGYRSKKIQEHEFASTEMYPRELDMNTLDYNPNETLFTLLFRRSYSEVTSGHKS